MKELVAAIVGKDAGRAQGGQEVEHTVCESDSGGKMLQANGHAHRLGGFAIKSEVLLSEHEDSDLPELAWTRIRDSRDPLASGEVKRARDDLGYIARSEEEMMVAAAASSDPAVVRLYEWYGQTNVFQFVRYVLAHCRFKGGKGKHRGSDIFASSSMDFASL
jgi:hypothetical protein